MADMRFIVAQLGARRHYAVPWILHEAGMLARLYTDSYVGNKPWLERALGLMPAPFRSGAAGRLLGRTDEGIPPAKVTSFDAFGLQYARAQRRAQGTAELAGIYADFGRRFCERIVARRPDAGAIWAFNGAALELFRWAKDRGIRCVLDQTCAPRRLARDLIAEELERWPGWEPGTRLPPEPNPLAEREEAEWALADRILAGSPFVVDGIRQCGGPVHKCAVVPYGVDTRRFAPAASSSEQLSRRRLRVLFAGEIGLRKGAPYLLEALHQLGPGQVEARFAGSVALARDRLVPYRDVATFLGPVPRVHMPQLYRWADVLVLPSLSEGSASVVYEALAAGVYVITTPNAGSVLTADSPGGEVIPIRTTDAIVDALQRRHSSGPSKFQNSPSPGISTRGYAQRLVAEIGNLGSIQS
jgi:glycosyltransferase involved in cell wall biosynthesis